MKLGLIGCHIQNSKSPMLHRHFGAIAGIDISYQLFDLADATVKNDAFNFKHLVHSIFEKKDVDGLSVTSPFKKIAFEFCDYLDQSCINTKSVNTIIYRDGKYIGFNTDIQGFDIALNSKFNLDQIKTVLIIGTGDVVPSIVNCISNQVDSIHITGRDYNKAFEVGSNIVAKNVFGCKLSGLDEHYDLVINATPGQIVLPTSTNFTNVFDLSYDHNSAFIQDVIKDGKDYIQGDSMLLYQAIEAFKIFTGHQIDIAKHGWLLSI